MNDLSSNHLEQSTRAMNRATDRLEYFMEHSDPGDPQTWETVIDLTMKASGAGFAATQEFKIEHFLAKSLISSI